MTIRPLNWCRMPATDRSMNFLLAVRDEIRAHEKALRPLEVETRTSSEGREYSFTVLQLVSDISSAALENLEGWLAIDSAELTKQRDNVLKLLSSDPRPFVLTRDEDGQVLVRAGDTLLAKLREQGINLSDFKIDPTVLAVDTDLQSTPIVAADDHATDLLADIEEDPRNSKPLNLTLALADSYDGLIKFHCDAAFAKSGDKTTRQNTDQTRLALRLLLGNLWRAWQVDNSLYVSLSLAANGYPRGPLNPTGIGSRAVRRVVDYLSSTSPALCIVRRGAQFRDATGKRSHGYFTRLRATDELAALIEKATNPGMGDASEPDPYSPSASKDFRIHHLPLLRLKDEKKRPLTDWDATPETDAMEERLRRYNAFLSLNSVDLLLPDVEFRKVVSGHYRGSVDEFGDTRNADSRRVDILLDRSLHRVFNNGSFSHGGRFYGGWWQNIPSRFRKFVTINWTPTVELDYSGMQPRMLYAMEELPLDEDAYSIEGIDAGYRNLIKRTLLKLINAKGRMKAPLRSELPPSWQWRDVLQALREKHAPISKYFGSGIGIELQRKDADIAEDIMQQFMGRDVLVLPVHDSFLTYLGNETKLNLAMSDAFKKRFGQEIKIGADEKFVQTVLGEKAVGLDNDGVYNLEDAVEDYINEPQFAMYRARREDFLSNKDEHWRWRFHSR